MVELEEIAALLRRRGLQGGPEVLEIRPEIRSAGLWHLQDSLFDPDQAGAGTEPKIPPAGDFNAGMLLRQVSYFVPPAEAARFQAWLSRNEPSLHKLAPPGVTYLGTFGVFGRGSTYATFWRYASFAAIQRMAKAVGDPLNDFGGVLRVMQQFPQVRAAEDYVEQLYLPAGGSGLLTPGVGRDDQPGGARAP